MCVIVSTIEFADELLCRPRIQVHQPASSASHQPQRPFYLSVPRLYFEKVFLHLGSTEITSNLLPHYVFLLHELGCWLTGPLASLRPARYVQCLAAQCRAPDGFIDLRCRGHVEHCALEGPLFDIARTREIVESLQLQNDSAGQRTRHLAWKHVGCSVD